MHKWMFLMLKNQKKYHKKKWKAYHLKKHVLKTIIVIKDMILKFIAIIANMMFKAGRDAPNVNMLYVLNVR